MRPHPKWTNFTTTRKDNKTKEERKYEPCKETHKEEIYKEEIEEKTNQEKKEMIDSEINNQLTFSEESYLLHHHTNHKKTDRFTIISSSVRLIHYHVYLKRNFRLVDVKLSHITKLNE